MTYQIIEWFVWGFFMGAGWYIATFILAKLTTALR